MSVPTVVRKFNQGTNPSLRYREGFKRRVPFLGKQKGTKAHIRAQMRFTSVAQKPKQGSARNIGVLNACQQTSSG